MKEAGATRPGFSFSEGSLLDSRFCLFRLNFLGAFLIECGQGFLIAVVLRIGGIVGREVIGVALGEGNAEFHTFGGVGIRPPHHPQQGELLALQCVDLFLCSHND